MMTKKNDIGVDILKKVKKDFDKEYKKSKTIKIALKKIKSNTATYEDAHKFSIEVGKILSSSLKSNINTAILPDGRMYWNIAKTILEPSLGNNYELISQFSCEVQNVLNRQAGLGLKAVKPSINEDKVYGIMNKIANAENFDDVSFMIDEPIINFSQTVVDDTVKVNIESHSKSGLRPTIKRIATGKCCKFCRRLEGTYNYPEDVPSDIYKRHRDCQCLVLYDPKDGRGIQDAHTKEWR